MPESSTVGANEPKKSSSNSRKDKFAELKKEIEACNWDAFEMVVHSKLKGGNYKLMLSSDSPTFNYDGILAKTISIDDIFQRIDGTDSTINEFLSKGLPAGRSYEFILKQGSGYICKTPPLRLHADNAGTNFSQKIGTDNPQAKGIFQQISEKMDIGSLGATLMGLSELVKAVKPIAPPPQKDESSELLKTFIAQQQSQQQSQQNASSELAEVIKAFSNQQAQQQSNSMTEMVKLMGIMNQKDGNSDNDLMKSFLEMSWEQRKIDREETKEMIEGIGHSMNDPIEQMERLEELKQRLTPARGASAPPIAGATGAEQGKTSSSTLDKFADIAVGAWEAVQRKQQVAYQQQVEQAHLQAQAQANAEVQAYEQANRIGEMIDDPVADPTSSEQQAQLAGIENQNATTQPAMMESDQMLSIYEGELQRMIDSKADTMSLFLAIKEYVLFAKENNLSVPEIEEQGGDLAEAFKVFVARRSDDQQYVSKLMSAAEGFRPILNDFSFDNDPTAQQIQIVEEEQAANEDADKNEVLDEGSSVGSPVSDDATKQAQINS
ncbi:MAG: hypothetical protein VX409_02875 [Verrucomicrobiota bacterium]|nr:hypothetical protein [Verrucomicrobiota bacterium]